MAIGGGSPMDTAKAAAVAFANEGDLRDYAGYDQVPGPGLPLVAVPTTAGTGSEVTRVAVITDTDRDVKMMMLDGHLMARVAISDYRLTMSTPANLTSWVGVDSLTHAIEAYVSKKATVLTDMLALEAARLIGAHMRRVVENPDDEQGREAMMLGATLAGAAFSNSSVALVHGMSRPIGAHFHLAHGLSNALLLPTVTRFSVTGAPERYAHRRARDATSPAPRTPTEVACRAPRRGARGAQRRPRRSHRSRRPTSTASTSSASCRTWRRRPSTAAARASIPSPRPRRRSSSSTARRTEEAHWARGCSIPLDIRGSGRKHR